MRAPVTICFDILNPVGQLMLRDDVEITPDTMFGMSYTVEEKGDDGEPTKIRLRGLALIPVSALPHLPKDMAEWVTHYKRLLREIRIVASGESSPGYPSIQQRIVEMVDQALGQEIPDEIDDRQG